MSGRDSSPLEPESFMPPRDPAASGSWRRRMFGWGFTGIVHLAVLAALLWPHAPLHPPRAEAPSIQVSVLETPKPSPPGPPDNSVSSSLPDAVEPAPSDTVMPVVTVRVPVADTSDILTDHQIAGAARVGESGGGGGGCDIARALQQVLRRAPPVRAAAIDAGRAGTAGMWSKP